jgi:hypothetical protein
MQHARGRFDLPLVWRKVGEKNFDPCGYLIKLLKSLALPRGLQGPSNFSGLPTKLATDVSRSFS